MCGPCSWPPTPAELVVALNGGRQEIQVPPNKIPAGCRHITPEMLTLVSLTREEIGRIVGAVPGGAANIQDIYPLAPLQQGILFHHLLSAESDAYVLASVIRFQSSARLRAFLDALQLVIDRHDILRTAVHWEGLSEPVQVVWRSAKLAAEEIDVAADGGDALEQLTARSDPRHYRLDVRKAPMVRAIIAEDKPAAGWLLQILSHHLVTDHMTVELIIAEVGTILNGQAAQLPVALPFREFIAQARLGIDEAESEAFFKAMLADVTEPSLPFGLSDARGDGSDIEEAVLSVDPLLAEKIHRVARQLKVSAASVMHLAWAQVLSRICGRQDVVFGTLLFGRMQAGAGSESTLGLFINTLPVRIRLRGTVRQSVVDVHAGLTQLLRYEHAPLALAQRCSNIPAPAPLFSALLNYRHSRQNEGGEAAWDGVEFVSTEERTNYPCTLSVDDFGTGFALTAQVSLRGAAQRVCGYMQTALEHLVAALEDETETAIRSIDILPQGERRQLLEEWNDTARPLPEGTTLPELFEAQVARTPDAVAVVFEDECLTYGELNARANRLAHCLRQRGAGPDVLVGLCVERSLEMIVGLLGILKAGAAYVPLDPSYPQERLAYMADDARPVLVLTQQALSDRLDRGIARLCLDSEWEAVAGCAAGNPAPLADGGSPRLCDLHLGFDRTPQGRGYRARRLGQLPPGDGAGARLRPA